MPSQRHWPWTTGQFAAQYLQEGSGMNSGLCKPNPSSRQPFCALRKQLSPPPSSLFCVFTSSLLFPSSDASSAAHRASNPPPPSLSPLGERDRSLGVSVGWQLLSPALFFWWGVRLHLVMSKGYSALRTHFWQSSGRPNGMLWIEPRLAKCKASPLLAVLWLQAPIPGP